MADGRFLIQELTGSGASLVPKEDGEKFVWSSDKGAPIPEKGGGRAGLLGRWEFGGELKTTRWDPAGAASPTEHVMSAVHAPFTWRGKWDDRHNFAGYAVKEMERFEAMCRRGNRVLIQFQGQAFYCLIKTWKFSYKMRRMIGYEFTTSTHARVGGAVDNGNPPSPSAVKRFDEASAMTAAMKLAHDGMKKGSMRRAVLPSPFATDGDMLDALVKRVDDARAELGRIIDSSPISRGIKPIQQFKRIATQFRAMGGHAFEITTQMAGVRADIDVTVRTAMSVLDFEAWSRTVRYQNRLIAGHGAVAGKDMDRRADPKAKGFYRPRKGEHLYSVSRRAYGTPHGWRDVAERNDLTVMQCTGDELLIIPERSPG